MQLFIILLDTFPYAYIILQYKNLFKKWNELERAKL